MMFPSEERAERALRAIKAVVDAVDCGTVTITMGGHSDYYHHIYDVSVIQGLIRNHAYAGLGLNIPKP